MSWAYCDPALISPSWLQPTIAIWFLVTVLFMGLAVTLVNVYWVVDIGRRLDHALDGLGRAENIAVAAVNQQSSFGQPARPAFDGGQSIPRRSDEPGISPLR